jgi:hypothetical protein
MILRSRWRVLVESSPTLTPDNKLSGFPLAGDTLIAPVTTKLKATFGEALIAIVVVSVVALLSAVVGFVAGVALGSLFPGEASESALIFAPLGAVIFGTMAFVVVYRWFVHYGDPSSDDAQRFK